MVASWPSTLALAHLNSIQTSCSARRADQRTFGISGRGYQNPALSAPGSLSQRSVSEPIRTTRCTLGRTAAIDELAHLARARTAASRDSDTTDRAADLYHRSAAQRYHVSPCAFSGGPFQSCPTLLA